MLGCVSHTLRDIEAYATERYERGRVISETVNLALRKGDNGSIDTVHSVLKIQKIGYY